MRKFIVIASLWLAACSTSPVPAESAKPVPPDRLFAFQSQPQSAFGVLTLTRDSGLIASCCDDYVWINGVRAAKISPGETAKFLLQPGDTVIGVKLNTPGAPLVERGVEIKANQTRRYRISHDPSRPDISPTSY